MKMLVLENVKTSLFSVRFKENHVYQASLEAPPGTTLLGLAGAALGLKLEEVYSKNSILASIKCQVLINSVPSKKPLPVTTWKLQYGRELIKTIINREYYFGTNFTIVYAVMGEDDKKREEILRKLAYAFKYPKSSLSLGKRESKIYNLFMEIKITDCEEVQEDIVRFHGTIIPKPKLNYNYKDMRNLELSDININNVEIFKWPRYFEFGKKGERIEREYEHFLLIPYNSELILNRQDIPGKVFKYNDRAFVLY